MAASNCSVTAQLQGSTVPCKPNRRIKERQSLRQQHVSDMPETAISQLQAELRCSCAVQMQGWCNGSLKLQRHCSTAGTHCALAMEHERQNWRQQHASELPNCSVTAPLQGSTVPCKTNRRKIGEVEFETAEACVRVARNSNQTAVAAAARSQMRLRCAIVQGRYNVKSQL
jgi:hypothetical protein